MPKGVYQKSKKHIEFLRKLRIGMAPWDKGKKRPDISKMLTGRVFSEETKKKMRDNHYNTKGSNNPNWKGGISAERQSFYSSISWANIIKIIWVRDKHTCQRCGKTRKSGIDFAIHHIVSFKNIELRAEPSNLILLCKECHHWIHSNNNKNKQFIK